MLRIEWVNIFFGGFRGGFSPVSPSCVRPWLCVDITKPEPTMQHGGVIHLRVVKKDANFKTQTFYDLTLTYTLPFADKTSAR